LFAPALLWPSWPTWLAFGLAFFLMGRQHE
jgi:hypothetical protein